MEALIQHGQGRKSAFFFWYSSVFLPKGVSTEILYGESQLVERTREDKAGMGVCLSLPVYQITVQGMALCLVIK